MKAQRRVLAAVLSLLLLVTVLTVAGCGGGGGGCEHQWNAATCTAPRTCTLCGKVEGVPLGHTPSADDGDCTTAVLCSVCGETVTAARAAHVWNAESATEESDKHCTVCGYVAEEQLAHTHAKNLTHVEALAPNCTAAGNAEYWTCTCGKWFSDAAGAVEITDRDSVTIPATGHAHASEWSSDGTKHWHACACSDRADEAAHVWNATGATEESDKHCTVCGYVAEAQLAHTHAKNLTHVEALAPNCTAAGNAEYWTCTCGKWFSDAQAKNEITDRDSVTVPATGHAHASAWSSDGEKHWHACACSDRADEAAHVWNATGATEESDKHCTVCGYVAEEQLAHTHSFATALSFDDGGHYYASTCGHTDVRKDYTLHTYRNEVTEPTCTEQGYTAYTCVCGSTYRDDYTSAKGHGFATAQSFDEGGHWYASTCGHDAIKDYTAHVWETEVVEPTCTEQGYTEYTCACGYGYRSDFVTEKGHTVSEWTEISSSLYDAQSCKHAVIYTGDCVDCGKPQQKSDYVEKHAWTYPIKEGHVATCQDDGVKLQLCKNAECKYFAQAKDELPYSDENAHAWELDEVQAVAEMTSYHCGNGECTAKKNVVATEGTSASVPSGSVSSLDEVSLGNALIGFDEGIKDSLGKSGSDVEISAGTLEGSERAQAISDAELTPEQAELLGQKEIYDFTVTTTESISDLGGTATIRIPYVLSDGEDPDNVIVWYISKGALTAVPATYADGYVTFTTTHFSYYVAATVSPAQLCEYLKEHDENNRFTVLPTCTTGGYSICIRCGKMIEGSQTAPLGHDWHTDVIAERSCISNGVTRYACVRCGVGYETVVGATGHYYVQTEQRNPTCRQSGFTTYGCIYCEHSYTVTVPQSSHTYTSVTVPPTCEGQGYTQKTCLSCGDSLYTDHLDALGHTYGTGWSVSPEGHSHVCLVCNQSGEIEAHVPGAEATEQSAQICTVCEYVIVPQLSHTHKLTAVKAHAATCLEGGNVAYYTCECGKWFLDAAGEQLITDHSAVILLAKGHTHKALPYVEPTCTAVGYTAGIACEVCDALIRGHVELPAYGHDYVTTEKAPTCTEEGRIMHVCAACGDKKADDVIPKLEHKYTVGSIKAPSCTEKGATTFVCTYCKDSYTGEEKDAYGHSYSTTHASDEHGHWFECTRCKERKEESVHLPGPEATEKNAQLCTACGYEIEPIRNHMHAIAKAVGATSPTCDSVGNVAYYVCACGEWFFDGALTSAVPDREGVILPALGHELTHVAGVAPTCTQAGYSDGYYCGRCEKYVSGHKALDALGHTPETVKGHAPTCEGTGLTDGEKCTVCGTVTVAQEVIPATGHRTEIIKGYAPTCEGTGLTDGERCTVCTKVTVAQEVIPATGHRTEIIKGYAPTCEGTGLTDGEKCTVCTKVTVAQEVIPATGHRLETVKGYAPTCEADGLSDGERCTVCKKVTVAQEGIPATGHRLETVKGYAPTCEVDGLSDGERCTVCGTVTVAQESIPATGHRLVAVKGHAPTCEETGLTDGEKCTVCGTVTVAQEVIPATGHRTEIIKGYAPTCEGTGLTDGERCTVCTEVTVAQEVIPAMGHRLETIKGYAPTCEESGLSDGERCTVCKKVTVAQEVIPATGHRTETLKGYAPTCEESGLSNGERCTVCGIVTVEQKPIPATGHRFEVIKGHAPTCEADGLTDGEGCVACGIVTVAQEVIPALGHTTEIIKGYAPTCEETGLTDGEKCTVCGTVTVAQEVIPATGHLYEDGLCVHCGKNDSAAEPDLPTETNTLEVVRRMNGDGTMSVTLILRNTDVAGILLDVYYDGASFLEGACSEENAQYFDDGSCVHYVWSNGENTVTDELYLLDLRLDASAQIPTDLAVSVVQIYRFAEDGSLEIPDYTVNDNESEEKGD